MNAIRIRKHIDSDVLHLPELKPLIGKTVEIIVLEETAVLAGPLKDPGCFPEWVRQATFDPKELEAMRPSLTEEQYEALLAIASQGGPDIDAILQIRVASMI